MYIFIYTHICGYMNVIVVHACLAPWFVCLTSRYPVTSHVHNCISLQAALIASHSCTELPDFQSHPRGCTGTRRSHKPHNPESWALPPTQTIPSLKTKSCLSPNPDTCALWHCSETAGWRMWMANQCLFQIPSLWALHRSDPCPGKFWTWIQSHGP